jgi:hypothetical protein
MVPAFDSSDGFVRVGGLYDWLGLLIVFGEEAIDCHYHGSKPAGRSWKTST